MAADRGAAAQAAPRAVQFVVKITKYCNLRCSYCYEFTELGKKERMSLDNIGRMFGNILCATDSNQLESIDFIWHGGEPLLVPIDYYRAIDAMQHEVFGDKIAVSNTVQTNLTVLTSRHVEFLRSKAFFSSLGISFDVYGDQRVDIRGRSSTQAVLANLQTLIDNEIDFGAIVVLSHNTLPHVRRIFHFFDELKIGLRFLPFYLNASDEKVADHQIASHALSYDELIGAFKTIFDEWVASRHAIPVEPIDAFIDFAISHLSGKRDWTYRKSEVECVFVVNIDGGIWAAGNAYVDGQAYGNLFQEDFGTVLTSPNRQRLMSEAERRIAHYCGGCPYHGACPGHFVGDASPQQQQLLADSGCPVREMIGYIIERFAQTGLTQTIAQRAGLGQQRLPLIDL